MTQGHDHDDEPAIRPSHLGPPEKISQVVRDVTDGVVEFLEGEPLVHESHQEGTRSSDEPPLEGEQSAP